MRRLLVNDLLTVGGERTFWHDLQEWFDCQFIGGEFATLADKVAANNPNHPLDDVQDEVSLIIRNASYFPPLEASAKIPTISLLQDIFTEGPAREMQEVVMRSSTATVFNSLYTQKDYDHRQGGHHVIPLPVDFSVFEPQNAMGCQQALGLPEGCICWVGACLGAAGNVKGFDIFLKIVRLNPDLHFVGVFKDAIPDSFPPNLRCYLRLSHEELVRVIGACRVGLCTSRTESQHLAGIEMGACGLPLVVPNVGCYWKRGTLKESFPGVVYHKDTSPSLIAAQLRNPVWQMQDKDRIREHWKQEFDRPVIRAQWEALVREVESVP